MGPVSEPSDEALLLAWQGGDSSAFEALFRRWQGPLRRHLTRMLDDAAAADDLVVETFLRLERHRGRWRPGTPLRPWLFTIARNLCLNEIRRRSRHPAESLDQTHAEADDQPLHQVEDKRVAAPPEQLLHGELEQKITDALAELPENQRIALLLCRQEELSYEEIAEVLGCSLSATKSLIHRGRETLKTKLKPYLRTGAWRSTK